MTAMSKLFVIFFSVVFFMPLCHGQEKKEVTKAQDKLTLEKARAALAQSEKEKGLFFKPLFDLPENPISEIIDTKLTYRKALAALEAYQKKQPAKTKSDKRVLYQKSSKKEK